jgi:tellurite resistance protein
MSEQAQGRRQRRVAPNLFGMPFGVAGLGDVWAAARPLLSNSQAVPNTLFIISAVLWLVVLVAYASQGPRRIVADCTDKVVSPFVSLAFITPTLLSAQLVFYEELAAKVLVSVFLSLTILFGGWITGQWIIGALELDHAHPGYFLPTVAGGFICAYAAALVHLRSIGQAAFGVGVLCWVLLGSLLLSRLFFRPMLPMPLVPTLAIEIAPPAVGGIAYFALNGHVADFVAAILGGYAILMLLVQLRFIPLYAKLRFSPALWAFSFSYASVATIGLLWLGIKHPPATTAYASILVGLITLFMSALFIRTLVAVARGKLLPPRTGP